MNYTPEQISQIVLRVLKEVNTPDISSLSIGEKLYLARNPSTTPETLDRLADECPYVVAQNPNTAPEALSRLADDEDVCVRCRVAKNPNTSTETLARLADDEDYQVCKVARSNPNYNPTTTITLTKKQKDALLKLIESSQDESLKTIQLQ